MNDAGGHMPSPWSRTFASQLKHFARSVDIVDDATFDSARRLIYQYVRNELGAEYFELMREQPVGDRPGLATFWSSGEKEHVFLVRAPEGSHPTIVARAFDLDQPMWVVNADKSPLTQVGGYEDQWSGGADIPRYTPAASQQIRTLVVVPLRRRRVLGVYHLEIAPHLGITEVAKTELQLLADAIAILFELWEVNKNQTRLTREAIDDLDNVLRFSVFPRLTQPGLFVAYSQNADQAVVGVMREVLDDFSDRFDIIDWHETDEAGSITTQIVKQIARSKFGLCYLSEPDGENRYVDNSNVLFESGMLHALTNPDVSRDEPGGWIPIREEHSPPAPFDFASERMLIVPRSRSGEVDRTGLRNRLERRLRSLLIQG